MTIDEQILSELQEANGKYDEILKYLEEMNNEETSVSTTETETGALENLTAYEQYIVDSSKVSLSLSLCTLAVLLILLGSFLARIIFRKF